MYTLKSIARQGGLLSVTAGLLVATVIPAASAFADALNPLTERSLLLSSSAPGYTDTDGSGNPTYAPAGSGPNGKKTGQTFTFKVSTDSTGAGPDIKGMSLQYCTNAAGNCRAPGDNQGDARDDLPAPRETNLVAHPLKRSDLDIVGNFANTTTSAAPTAGEFQVLVNGTAQNGWTMSTINAEDTGHSENLTGKKNMIYLTHATGIEPAAGDVVQVVFKASESVYITNPGSGSFFVKINTYQTDDDEQMIPAVPAATNNNIIDGGVTVANVMTDSIHITTKVLETMAFSVGTQNRDNVTVDCKHAQANTDPDDNIPDCEADDAVHGTCSPIQNINNNRLNLGDPDAEYSLQTNRAWDAYSYWRLSSNSSGGATVYYSGNTLANTVGDEISDMINEAPSTPGTEQFGLGFVDAGLDTPGADFTGNPSRSFPFRTLFTQTAGDYDLGTLPTQPVSTGYDEATGTIFSANASPGTAKFKFLKSSLTVPEPIAQQNDQVISCATAKMRYVGNIGADTPAGVYTTKINYLAAPQY